MRARLGMFANGMGIAAAIAVLVFGAEAASRLTVPMLAVLLFMAADKEKK